MESVEEASVWKADDFRHTRDWIEPFTAEHLDEINAALEHLRATGMG